MSKINAHTNVCWHKELLCDLTDVYDFVIQT